MNFKSERGQSAVLVGLIIVFIAVVAWLGITSMGSQGYQDGAEVIGESIGEVIDGMTSQPADAEIDAMVAAERAVRFWLNSQKLVPNKHSVDRHGADAWAATNCYNNNGFFQMWQVKNQFGGFDLHGLCQDNDQLVYDVILRRDGTSNRYNFITAFKPKGGFMRAVINYIKLGQKGQQVAPPSDIIIYVDNVIVP